MEKKYECRLGPVSRTRETKIWAKRNSTRESMRGGGPGGLEKLHTRGEKRIVGTEVNPRLTGKPVRQRPGGGAQALQMPNADERSDPRGPCQGIHRVKQRVDSAKDWHELQSKDGDRKRLSKRPGIRLGVNDWRGEKGEVRLGKKQKKKRSGRNYPLFEFWSERT